jgi:hypothetical protein
MRVFRESDSERRRRDAISLATGAVVGLVIGFLISRPIRETGRLGGELRERMKGAARRLRPARLERLERDQEELDRLESDVVDEFLRDEVLSERALDIGAISSGIIELSGSVFTEEEAQRAVSVARRVPGVLTVVNRIEAGTGGSSRLGRRLDIEDVGATFTHQEGRVGGMGRRRQSAETEPERPDDSQRRREGALAAADRDQWAEEGYAPVSGRSGESSDLRGVPPTNFAEDELDNQDPHGRNADVPLDDQPQELRSDSRVGEGPTLE